MHKTLLENTNPGTLAGLGYRSEEKTPTDLDVKHTSKQSEQPRRIVFESAKQQKRLVLSKETNGELHADQSVDTERWINECCS